jgi:predicted transcriptional regulator
MTDFINDENRKSTDNRTANNIKQTNLQFNILNGLVKELKNQIKQRDELLKKIEKSLGDQKTTNDNPAIVDNLLINIAQTLKEKTNKATTENV